MIKMRKLRRMVGTLIPSGGDRRPDHRRRFAGVESLEGRSLLTAWVQQGPGPIINAQTMGITSPQGNNPVIGAVETVAPSPTDPNTIYAGTVNGGIWKTTNATAASPTWTPLTDNLPAMTITDLRFNPQDGTQQTLYAATGNNTYSSGNERPARPRGSTRRPTAGPPGPTSAWPRSGRGG